MRINYILLDKLSKETPRHNILQWVILTALYGFVIIVNDHFDLIAAIGLPPRHEAIIRLCGVYLYIILTAFQFQKTRKYEKHTYHHKVATDLENHDQLHHLPPANGTEGDAQGN